MGNNLKYVSVFSGNREDSKDWPPESPKEFLAWFAAKFDEIPDEYKHRATVVLTEENVYEYPCAAIEIDYFRPETEDEIKRREKSQGIIDRQNKARDLKTIRELIIKYHGPKARVVDKE